MKTVKLTDRQFQLLGECCNFAIQESIVGKNYYRLGGHGMVSMRYDYRTSLILKKLGLIEDSGCLKATDKGKLAFEQENRRIPLLETNNP